ncbi:MAG: hypothetical protein C5B57_07775 [Blastocatellia bacterium]|nr:MAG: hypothetical protein C5B57_07775 [Blastocatellia bacterium]
MSAITQVVSAALIDFIWQAMLVAIALRATLFLLKDCSANVRYAASCAALAFLAVLPVVTATLLYARALPVGIPNFRGGTGSPPLAAVPQTMLPISIGGQTPPMAWLGWAEMWALPVWSLGVVILSARLAGGCTYAFAVRRRSKSADESLLAIVLRLARRMGIDRPIRVVSSSVTDGPSVIGWLRPVILLPPAAVIGLSLEQLEAVLAHEIAHIKRHDALVNMLQIVVETLLFYHPVVWWTSNQIRLERELCCDDLAVRACGDALSYARALTMLEKRRLAVPRLALGSTGASLLYRIQRLIGARPTPDHGSSHWMGVLAICLGAIFTPLNVSWIWARAQGQAETRLEFEVASIKPNKSGSNMVQIGGPPGRFTATNVTLAMLIRQAYGLQNSQLVGGPAWVNSDRFDIVAKAEGSPEFGFFTQQNASPSRTQLMMRSLLGDRFKLAVHNESRELPIYALLPARTDGRLGPQLSKSAVDCAAEAARGRGPAGPGGPKRDTGRGVDGQTPGGRGQPDDRGSVPYGSGDRPRCGLRIGPGTLSGGGVVLSQLATTLSIWVNRIVVDKTGLAGTFDVDLKWTPDQMPASGFLGGPGSGVPGPGAAGAGASSVGLGTAGTGRGSPAAGAPALPPIDPSSPSIFTAVQEQLGLKLDSQRGPVDVLVIDHVEPPSED